MNLFEKTKSFVFKISQGPREDDIKIFSSGNQGFRTLEDLRSVAQDYFNLCLKNDNDNKQNVFDTDSTSVKLESLHRTFFTQLYNRFTETDSKNFLKFIEVCLEELKNDKLRI